MIISIIKTRKSKKKQKRFLKLYFILKAIKYKIHNNRNNSIEYLYLCCLAKIYDKDVLYFSNFLIKKII
jgi:hypothetical protein